MRKIHIFLMALFSVLVCPQIVEASITIKVTAPNGLIGYNQYEYEDLRSAIYIRYWNDSISAQTDKMYSYGEKYYSVTFNDNIKTINFQIQIIDEWGSIIKTDTFSNITESISIELGDWDPENGIYNNSIYEYEYPMDYTITESANWTLDTVTLYLNNQLLGGFVPYLFVSIGSVSYEERSNPVLPITKATALSDGWYTYSFMFDPSSTYHVQWSSYSIENDTTISYLLSNQQGTDNAYEWYEDYDYDNIKYHLRTTTLRPLDATNSYTIHVDQPGSMAYLILEAAEQWTNVRGLTITGTLNDEDMKYLSYMKNLQRLDLSGADITSIHGCSGLECLQKVILPESVTEIGANAFNGCVRLYDINLNNITTIGEKAFYESAITSVYLPKATTISAYAFTACFELETVNLPVATTIEDYTFRECYSLSDIAFPLVTTIGEGAFRLYDDGVYGYLSKNMKEIDLSNVTSLGKGAFYGVSTLEKVILSDELEVLPERCFYYCEGLKEINIPSALKAIEDEALYRTAIEDLTLPEGVTTIGSSIFNRSYYESSDLKTLTLPSTLRSIASDAFASCGNLTDVYLYRIIPPTTAMGFNEDITLHVPAISLLDYKLSDTWNHIDNIVPIDGDANPITNLLIDNSYSLLSAEGFASKVDLDLHAGAEFTIGNNATLNIGTFTQTIGTNTNATRIYYDENGDYMYDEEGNRIYKYYSETPYNASFINYATLSADNAVIRLVPRSNQWNFFSLPFDVRIQDITIDAMGIGTQGTHQWVIREYSGANRASGNGDTWLNVPADGTLKAHQGYILYWVCEGGSSTSANNFYYYFNLPAANTTTAQQMFTKDNVIVPLTEYMAESEQNRNWNLVGNPYPSFFDIQHMDFNAPITTWNGYGYQAYSLLDDSYRLRPAEAFFVQAPQGTTAITFNQEGRSLENKVEITEDEYNNRDYAPQRKQTASSSTRQVYNFLINNADYTDKARLVLNESARTAYDMTCDAAKMMSSNASVPQIYVNNNGTRYAIDERPTGNGEYILGVHFGKADTYTLQLQSTCSDQQVLLIDTETNLSVDLSQTPYSFTANAGDNPSRFRITIKQGVTTDIPTQVVPSSQPYKTIENGQLIIVQPNGKKYSVGGIQL